MQPLSGNQRPNLQTAHEHVTCIVPATRKTSCEIHRFRICYKSLTICSLLTRCIIPEACHAKQYLNVHKCSEPVRFFTRLTSKCASRHSGMHFFDISTSKLAPTLKCFVHFEFQMCFVPKRHALFRNHSCQKWSEHGPMVCSF